MKLKYRKYKLITTKANNNTNSTIDNMPIEKVPE